MKNMRRPASERRPGPRGLPIGAVLSIGIKDANGIPRFKDRYWLVNPRETKNGKEGRRELHPTFATWNHDDRLEGFRIKDAPPPDRVDFGGEFVHRTAGECYHTELVAYRFPDLKTFDTLPHCRGDGDRAERHQGALPTPEVGMVLTFRSGIKASVVEVDHDAGRIELDVEVLGGWAYTPEQIRKVEVGGQEVWPIQVIVCPHHKCIYQQVHRDAKGRPYTPCKVSGTLVFRPRWPEGIVLPRPLLSFAHHSVITDGAFQDFLDYVDDQASAMGVRDPWMAGMPFRLSIREESGNNKRYPITRIYEDWPPGASLRDFLLWGERQKEERKARLAAVGSGQVHSRPNSQRMLPAPAPDFDDPSEELPTAQRVREEMGDDDDRMLSPGRFRASEEQEQEASGA